jgi:hypothetical protein
MIRLAFSPQTLKVARHQGHVLHSPSPMSSATFLSNEELWQTLIANLKSSRHVDAAIAYVGQGGAKLFPLRRGDRLVVDMSLATVRAGATDPREIEKLVRRGVECFTRRNLHSKLVVGNTFVIAGSANVSGRAYLVLDEAALLTKDSSAIRRGREFIDRLCTEPVRPEYLNACKRQYKPPHFAGQGAPGKRQQRTTRAKLWIVNLVESSIPESELMRYEKGEAKAEKLVKNTVSSKTESFHWPHKPKMADELESGDWIIQAMKSKDGSVLVHAPGQLLFIDKYVRDPASGKQRYVFHLELPKRGEALTWRDFHKAAGALFGRNKLLRRTRPVRNLNNADALLRLWTPTGRISRR